MSNQITSDTGSTNPFLKKSDDQLQISPISDGQNNITDCEPHCLTVVNEEGFLQRILSHKQVLSALLNELQLQKPIKLTTSSRSKLTTCFAGEDLSVHVC